MMKKKERAVAQALVIMSEGFLVKSSEPFPRKIVVNIHMGVSENRGPGCTPRNSRLSRILIIRTPK